MPQLSVMLAMVILLMGFRSASSLKESARSSFVVFRTMGIT